MRIPGQDRHRDVAGQRRGEQQHAQQSERVDHARDGSLRAGADVGRRAGDGAGGRQAAEHRRNDVGDALADQFDIGIVTVVAHAV